MFLERLTIINFKNIEGCELDFSSKLNCFIGDNGAGKTNLLDSIHYLSFCKSGFGLSDLQCVTHAKDFFMLDGQYSVSDYGNQNIVCSYTTSSGKNIKKNGKQYQKLSEHIGIIPAVIVSPSDTSIINESGDERRRFINLLLSQTDKEYLGTLVRYNNILANRNRVLKNISSQSLEMLDIYDLQLAELGTYIHFKRSEILSLLSPLTQKYYSIISGDKENIEMNYRSQLNKDSFENILLSSREKDMINQHTTCGIHRDDIRMRIMDYPIRRYGSQGQQKSFTIALKLAQFDIIAKSRGVKPLLLLDDIFDKLDSDRVKNLITLVADERFGQIFITDCNKARLNSILSSITQDHTIFNVKSGEIDKI